MIITPTLSIADYELTYHASRSGGPGGQHVNTSSTRIELLWNVAESQSLTDQQRHLLLKNLRHRLDSTGQLRLVSTTSRSQLANRRDVLGRLQELVSAGLVIPKKRKKTKPSRAARERRLTTKKKQGEKKEMRRKPHAD
ncbi:MAG: alternative ribosome rescue aminoacyl-tRNA hydrolase ArfB [Gemmatimonadota bacterium]